MRVFLAALFLLAAFAVVLATRAKGSDNFTTHIGSRVPPVEAGCYKTGDVRSDEGKVLNVYRCPI